MSFPMRRARERRRHTGKPDIAYPHGSAMEFRLASRRRGSGQRAARRGARRHGSSDLRSAAFAATDRRGRPPLQRPADAR